MQGKLGLVIRPVSAYLGKLSLEVTETCYNVPQNQTTVPMKLTQRVVTLSFEGESVKSEKSTIYFIPSNLLIYESTYII